MFEELYRVDDAGSSRPGLGLWLYTMKRFAELLGHELEVRSAVGKGTMSALVISSVGVTAAAPRASGQRPDADVTHPTILLVEDDAAQLDSLRLLLELEGYRVPAAGTGDDTLLRLRELPDIRPDIIMPGHNLRGATTGLQLIQRVRAELTRRFPPSSLPATGR